MANPDTGHHHLELLTGFEVAGLLDISYDTFRRKRRCLPSPLRLGHRRLWFRSELAHLLPRARYSDTVTGPTLAGLRAPGHVEHRFRRKPNTHSDASRTLIPTQAEHRFRAARTA